MIHPQRFTFQQPEATLSWIALGLLLAAWNAVDRETFSAATKPIAAPRPVALRGYPAVSVRALSRHLRDDLVISPAVSRVSHSL